MHQRTPLPSFDREVPAALQEIVRRLCAKQPEDRYPSAQELLVDLKRLLLHPPQPAAEAGTPAVADPA